MKKQTSSFVFLCTYIYLAFWVLITFIGFRGLNLHNDAIVNLLAIYNIVTGMSKIVVSTFSLILLYGARSSCLVCLTKIIILMTRIVDAALLIIYAYKGIIKSDPMAFLFFVPKTFDTVVLWYVTSVDGSINPCRLCERFHIEEEEFVLKRYVE